MKKSILVVDDDERLLHVLALFFEVKGYVVRTAAGGAQAMAAIEEERPDGIVLDVMMPDIDGLEVCRQLRATMTKQQLPIIILTAAREVEHDALAAGADAFVSKPFDLEELGGPVENLIGKRR